MKAALETLVACRTVDAVVECLRGAARDLAGADGITVIRREGDEVVYVTEDAIAPLWHGQRFPIGVCVTGMAMLSGEPILIPDIRNDRRVPLNAYLGTFVQSMAVFPIGRVDPHWAMGAYWRQARPLPEQAIERLTALAALAGEVIAGIEAEDAARDAGGSRAVA